MKKLIIEQTGFVQILAERQFVLEVPSDLTEEQIDELHEELVDIADVREIGWIDEAGNQWVGFDMDHINTLVHDPDAVLGSPADEGLKTVRLDVSGESDLEGQPEDEQ